MVYWSEVIGENRYIRSDIFSPEELPTVTFYGIDDIEHRDTVLIEE